PAKQSPGRHQQHAPRRARQMTGRSRQQRPVSHRELRPRYLPAQDPELVAEYQQLDVLHVQSAAATNKRPEKRPNSDIEKGERHGGDPASPPHAEATPKLAPFTSPCSAMGSHACSVTTASTLLPP